MQVHSHEARREHAPEKCDAELELLSVICSANSHYVCFTRDPERKWLFFDSMANRVCKLLSFLSNESSQFPMSPSHQISNTTSLVVWTALLY